MEKMILKNLAIFALIFSLTACSQKTSTPTATTQNASVNEEANRRGGQQDGERGGKRERPQFADLLTKMDANKDGLLALTEVDDRLKERFPQIDTNQDGFISEEEFKNAPKPERGGRGGRN